MTNKSLSHWIVTNDHGCDCGHCHRTLSGAVACRKSLDRAERNRRARFGGPRNVWAVEPQYVSDVTGNKRED